MAYPTLAEIKARVGVTGGDQDVLLQHSLTVARGAVESYCGYEWPSTGPAEREFQVVAQAQGRSLFDVADPGLLVWSAATARRRYDDSGEALGAEHVELRRFAPGGVGPFARFSVAGGWLWVTITGVWGQGTEPPAEVAEAVMLVAISVYTEALGGGPADDGAPVNAADWDGALVGFLLRGHRRAR